MKRKIGRRSKEHIAAETWLKEQQQLYQTGKKLNQMVDQIYELFPQTWQKKIGRQWLVNQLKLLLRQHNKENDDDGKEEQQQQQPPHKKQKKSRSNRELLVPSHKYFILKNEHKQKNQPSLFERSSSAPTYFPATNVNKLNKLADFQKQIQTYLNDRPIDQTRLLYPAFTPSSSFNFSSSSNFFSSSTLSFSSSSNFPSSSSSSLTSSFQIIGSNSTLSPYCLSNDDIMILLSDNCWINCDIINSFLYMLDEQHHFRWVDTLNYQKASNEWPQTIPTNGYWLSSSSEQLCLQPLHVNKTHWILLLRYGGQNYYIDTLSGGGNNNNNLQFIKQVTLYLTNTDSVQRIDVPTQPNFNDCGVAVLAYTKLIMDDPKSLLFLPPLHYSQLRNWLYTTLVHINQTIDPRTIDSQIIDSVPTIVPIVPTIVPIVHTVVPIIMNNNIYNDDIDVGLLPPLTYPCLPI